MFGHYLHNSDSVTSAYGSFVLGSGFPLVPVTDTRPGYSMVVSATAAFSPTLTNESNFGFGKNVIHIDAVGDGLTRTKTGINIPLLYPKAVQNDYIPRFAYAGSLIGIASPTAATTDTTPIVTALLRTSRRNPGRSLPPRNPTGWGRPRARWRRRSGRPGRSGSCAAKLTAETLPATRVEATLVKNRNVSGSIGWLAILGTQQQELVEGAHPQVGAGSGPARSSGSSR